MRRVFLILLLCAGFAAAQEKSGNLISPDRSSDVSKENVLVIPAGTKVPLVLRQAIWTKNAREGDSVYAQTNFPVVIDGVMAIPPGTYVQGKITRVQRPGRVKGKAEVQVNFTSMIFPNGYTVMLPGALDKAPDVDANIKGKEGTVEGQGSKGKDVGTVASNAGTGAAIGGLATQSGKGAAIGGVGGLAVGLATVLLTRGPDIKMENGSALEMVLEREISLDKTRAVDARFVPERVQIVR
jgi:type IV secretion system protein VirB10